MVIFISGYVSAAGSLAGLAIGDAMGAPFEGHSHISAGDLRIFQSGIFLKNQAHFTDDTLQAIAVAESLIQCRGYCPEDLIERLIIGYKRFPQYYGPTSRRAFEAVIAGSPPDRAAVQVRGERSGSRSNGSVMRGPPIGIFFRGEKVREVSLRCSYLTHDHPVAAECSAWVNQMVSDLCRGFSKTGAFSRALHRCDDEEVIRVLGGYHQYGLVPGLDALEATHAALSVFMESRTFQDAITGAIRLGGDTDTVAAIAGALAGAWTGYRGIPETWCTLIPGIDVVTSVGYLLWSVSESTRQGFPG